MTATQPFVLVSRRLVLRDAAVLSAMVGLYSIGACSNADVQQALTDLRNALTDLVNEVSAFGAIVGIPAATLTTINGAIQQAETLLANAASVLAAGGSGLQTALNLIGDVLTALQPFASVLPSPLNQIIPAIAILLPTIEAILGLSASTTTTASAKFGGGAAATFRGLAPTMSVARARLVVATYAVK